MIFQSPKIPWFEWHFVCVCVCVCVCVVIIHFASLRRSNFYKSRISFVPHDSLTSAVDSSFPSSLSLSLSDCRRTFIAGLVNGKADKPLNCSLPVNFNCPFGQVHGLWLVVKSTVGKLCSLAVHTQLYRYNYFTIISLRDFAHPDDCGVYSLQTQTCVEANQAAWDHIVFSLPPT
jgi:hypothetical protein